MPDSAGVRNLTSSLPAADTTPRHAALVRVTHWLAAIGFIALLVTGIEIVISHPRFYWGETGNVNTPPLFSIPIPASRAIVPTGYGFVLPDQNGWSRSLHFQAAWLIVLTGMLYGVWGFVTGHFRRSLLPSARDVAWSSLSKALAEHLRFQKPGEEDSSSYNVLQRLAYLAVIFTALPLMIWTGLAMSPAVTAAFPFLVTLLGGHQTARTLHFFCSGFLFLFLAVHVAMVWRAGFWSRTRAMLTGGDSSERERS